MYNYYVTKISLKNPATCPQRFSNNDISLTNHQLNKFLPIKNARYNAAKWKKTTNLIHCNRLNHPGKKNLSMPGARAIGKDIDMSVGLRYFSRPCLYD
jgi:hypothetical protein